MAASLDDLLPELRTWNDGKELGALDYIYAPATSMNALAYAALFWAEFIERNGYVLCKGFSVERLRDWERASSARENQIEAAAN